MLVALVALEAAWRVLRNAPRGAWSERFNNLALIGVVVASAGGLGIVIGGGGPADSLHYVYGAIAIFALPLTTSLVSKTRPRVAGSALFVVAVALLVVILRLFQTG